MELTHYFNNRIKRADAFEINKICGMDLSIGLENERSVQVGYFGKPCCVEWEEQMMDDNKFLLFIGIILIIVGIAGMKF